MDPVLGVAITAIATLLGVWATGRVSNRKLRSDGANQLVDQLQEENARLRRTERLQGDYIGVLRRHIAQEQGPPPPPYPDGLNA